MINIPIKTKERLMQGVKKFQAILAKAKDKDINESDTVTIIADMLTDVFGYDKYTDITSEYAIKKTFCDLAIKIDSKPLLLIEGKAIGLTLKDDYIRQAIDYGANSGIEWAVLTNGTVWKVYRVIFSRPIEKELVYEFDFSQISNKRQADLEMLYYISKESLNKPASKTFLDDFRTQKQILNRFVIGHLLLTDTVLECIKRQIKKLSPDSKVIDEEIQTILQEEIIKREIFEGEKAVEAKKRISKMNKITTKPATPKVISAVIGEKDLEV